MIFIYSFIAIGFPPGGSGQLTCTKIGKRQLHTEGETIHKTIQKHRIHKTENIQRILKNLSRVIRK